MILESWSSFKGRDGTNTHEVLDPVQSLLVREYGSAVVPEELQEGGWFGDVEANVIPVIKILSEGVRRGEGKEEGKIATT